VAARGGFDVVIGNPPFLEFSERTVPYRPQLASYRTAVCRNLYPCVVERGRALLGPGGWLGMILPLAAFSTRNMAPFSEAFCTWFPQTWVSFYHFRPAMLFSGGHPANIPTAIAIGRDRPPSVWRRTPPSSAEGVRAGTRLSTGVRKWPVAQRASLFPTLAYTEVDELPCLIAPHAYPKLSSPIENGLLRKLAAHPPVRRYLGAGDEGHAVYYRTAGGLYWKVIVNFPWPYQTTSNKRQTFQPAYDRDVFVALFNSSLFWWYYTVTFDTLNLKDYLLFGFPFTYPDDPPCVADLKAGARALMEEYRASAAHLKRGATGSYTVYARHAKPVLDRIDRALAAHYGLTDAELDFVVSYDVKHRMGAGTPEGRQP
jgi:hypothetical protein